MPDRVPVSVVVADDHPLYRDGLIRLLAGDPRVEVVGEAEDGSSALVALVDRNPDVAILDFNLPGLDAVAVLEALKRETVTTRVVVISASIDSRTVFRAMSAGAHGYVAKSATGTEILAAVLAAAGGEVVIPRNLQAGLISELHLRHETTERALLSAKEIEVLQHAAEGLTVEAIGQQLFVSSSTVKTHLQNIYQKLGVTDRTAAVAQAMRHGLLR